MQTKKNALMSPISPMTTWTEELRLYKGARHAHITSHIKSDHAAPRRARAPQPPLPAACATPRRAAVHQGVRARRVCRVVAANHSHACWAHTVLLSRHRLRNMSRNECLYSVSSTARRSSPTSLTLTSETVFDYIALLKKSYAF